MSARRRVSRGREGHARADYQIRVTLAANWRLVYERQDYEIRSLLRQRLAAPGTSGLRNGARRSRAGSAASGNGSARRGCYELRRGSSGAVPDRNSDPIPGPIAIGRNRYGASGYLADRAGGTLASGRVVDLRARLGDTVQKDQVLLRVRSDDVGLGFDAYEKAIHDELLARKQLDRAKDMYEHGAIAQQDLEVAQDAEDDALTSLDTTKEHLRLLGNDPEKPNGIVDIVAPISGVITDQEVTNAASVQAYSAPNPFTISDLSTVWVVCNVYENDMANMRSTSPSDIKLNAFPGRVFRGKVNNIGSILDPNIRTAKVRIEVANPGGIMRPGMFATATLFSSQRFTFTSVPASSILHLPTAIGSSFPGKENSAGPRLSPARHCRTTCKRFSAGCNRASRWCPMRSSFKTRWITSDTGLEGPRKRS